MLHSLMHYSYIFPRQDKDPHPGRGDRGRRPGDRRPNPGHHPLRVRRLHRPHHRPPAQDHHGQPQDPPPRRGEGQGVRHPRRPPRRPRLSLSLHGQGVRAHLAFLLGMRLILVTLLTIMKLCRLLEAEAERESINRGNCGLGFAIPGPGNR